jgi:hypothetical protein
VERVRLERILLRGHQAAHNVPLVVLALQAALQLRHAVDSVRLVIHALLAQLINMEELLQAVLVLVVEYVRLECILLPAQEHVHHVRLVLTDLHAGLQPLHAVDNVRQDIIAPRVRLINMEELPQAALVLVATYVLLDYILLQGRDPAHHAMLVNMALQPVLQLPHAVERVRRERILLREQ